MAVRLAHGARRPGSRFSVRGRELTAAGASPGAGNGRQA